MQFWIGNGTQASVLREPSGGILDAAPESRVRNHWRIEPPDLATLDHVAPADSGSIRMEQGFGILKRKGLRIADFLDKDPPD